MASILPINVEDLLNGSTKSSQPEFAAPWDDQVAQAAEIHDLREATVREYLHDVGSTLRHEQDALTIYRKMGITTPVNSREMPRNVGLLLFSDDPTRWFPGASIVSVQFPAGRSGEVQAEWVFRGPLPAQIRNCLRYLEGLAHSHVQKQRDDSRVRSWVSYPQPALREALVNAICHRGYEPQVMEPTKVCLYADRIEVISYPGPVLGLEPRHFAGPEPSMPPLGARNPRVGQFLKALGFAEGGRTGVSRMYRAMAENGSPEPRFDFGQGWFRATLPAHPEYAAVSALRDALYLDTVGSEQDAFRRIKEAWQANEASAVLATELIRRAARRGDVDGAERVFERFRAAAPESAVADVADVWAEIPLRHDRDDGTRPVDPEPDAPT